MELSGKVSPCPLAPIHSVKKTPGAKLPNRIPSKLVFVISSVPNCSGLQLVENLKEVISIKPWTLTSKHTCSPQLEVSVEIVKPNGRVGSGGMESIGMVSSQAIVTVPFCRTGVNILL